MTNNPYQTPGGSAPSANAEREANATPNTLPNQRRLAIIMLAISVISAFGSIAIFSVQPTRKPIQWDLVQPSARAPLWWVESPLHFIVPTVAFSLATMTLFRRSRSEPAGWAYRTYLLICLAYGIVTTATLTSLAMHQFIQTSENSFGEHVYSDIWAGPICTLALLSPAIASALVSWWSKPKR